MRLLRRGRRELTLTRYSDAERMLRTKDFITMMAPEGKPEALSDVVVLDASYASFAGIMAASVFAEFGAEVVKIEPPGGDPARLMTPYGRTVGGVGIPFLMEVRNKRFITLDLASSEKDREEFRKLAKEADILIETFGPGKMDSWGIGYRQLSKDNPGLIYIAISPYGHYTSKAREFANVPDTDLTAQAASGLPAVIGEPPGSPEPYSWPTRAGFWLGWWIAAISAVIGGMLALLYRQVTGKGQVVDVATADAYATCVGYPPTWGFVWKKSRPRIGPLDYCIYPYGIFRCKDGYVAMAWARDQDFRGGLKTLGLWRIEPDWRFMPDRIPDVMESAMSLYEEIERATSKYTADEIVKKHIAHSVRTARSKWRGGGIPISARVETPASAMKHPHWRIRGTFIELEHPEVGKFVVPAPVPKMTRTPPRIKWVALEPGKKPRADEGEQQ